MPMLLALSHLVVVPRYKCDNAEGRDDKDRKDDDEKGSAESRRSCIARGECVVVVMVHFDSSGFDAAVATRISRWICINYNSFARLKNVSIQCAGRQILRTAMLCVVWRMQSLRRRRS